MMFADIFPTGSDSGPGSPTCGNGTAYRHVPGPGFISCGTHAHLYLAEMPRFPWHGCPVMHQCQEGPGGRGGFSEGCRAPRQDCRRARPVRSSVSVRA